MTIDAISSHSTKHLVLDAVGPGSGFGWRGLQERLFAYLFRGLVYAQIWEDPEVDMAAMELQPHHHVVTIASGGCNALSYLMAGPARVTAVDLNRAHVALVRLKIAGAKYLPNSESFYRFFGEADDAANPDLYRRFLASQIDNETRAYWEGRNLWGQKRIDGFAKNIYRRGLLGKFIGAGHMAARFYGLNLQSFLDCQDLGEQRAYFHQHISPLFTRRLVKRVTKSPMALFGLGIPPAQYDALSGGGNMGEVLYERLRRLTCDYPLSENYFAWQAFGRAYAPDASGPLPPYLQEKNFDVLRDRASRLSVHQANMTHVLAQAPSASVDRVVLLDAQDWMTDEQLNALWCAITAAAAPGARVIFRTAGADTILPGRLTEDVLSRWTYLEKKSADLHTRDRSSIYGGFHVYELKA
ncbi:DUF3419 family protein [Aestuariivirga litoralis]|uniref:DUF3419 family protein n=1 Tax=Aestuariivirga litoralis TaxID=2650924 RepID=UPI0018C75B91|nr:DUF3419 family protein [Aestuariivirga litoralis]MBG1232614.1 DUF3419 family protein [Aestuariivirga litoralis]